jgi:broad specificity phosphatase PhoE
MKTVYLVRHGETEGNVGRFFQSNDTRLTPKGIEQAKVVANRCTKFSFDALVSSTMTRAQHTAQAIAERTGHEVELSGLFIERYRPDELAGKRRDDPSIQTTVKAWDDSLIHGGTRISNGENFDDLSRRTQDALDYLLSHQAKTLVVVTHGFFLRFLIARTIFGSSLTPALAKSVLSSFRMNNTGITMLQHGSHADNDLHGVADSWIVRIWNDHAHLG